MCYIPEVLHWERFEFTSVLSCHDLRLPREKEGERLLQLSYQAFVILYACLDLNIFLFYIRILVLRWVAEGSVTVCIDRLDCYFSESWESEIVKSIGKGGACIQSNKPNHISCPLLGDGERVVLFFYFPSQ